MKKTLLVLLLFCLTAHAKRALYTCELVGNAKVIGIWNIKDLEKKLLNPAQILKGDISLLKNVKINKDRLFYINSRVKDKQVILVFSIYNKNAYMDTLLRENTSFKENLKNVKEILTESNIINKWKRLSVKEKISNSDLIVRGKVLDSGKICPTSHYVKVDKFYKGNTDLKFSVITVSQNELNKNSLILLRKKPGTGPKYRIYSIVPINEAKEYLNKL